MDRRGAVVVLGIGGMGVAVVRRIGAGKSVILADFDERRLEDTAAVLRDEGFDVRPHRVDVADRESVRTLAAAAADTGEVEAVVHTAGLSPIQASKERILDVDLVGTAHVLDAFGEVIAPGGAGVVIASIAGYRVHVSPEAAHLLRTASAEHLRSIPELDPAQIPDNETCYALAKRGNQLRVESASVTWGLRGGRVNSISPGIISTPMALAELEGPSAGLMRDMIAQSGTHRIGTPYDIAEAVAFLVGPGSSFVTGIDLRVDGGVIAAFQE